VKETAKTALRMVSGASKPTRTSSSQANMAMKWRHQMEQNPKVKLPRKVQTMTPEKYREVRAWHIICVEVNAPSSDTATEAAIIP
jgi:hypothetical protein